MSADAAATEAWRLRLADEATRNDATRDPRDPDAGAPTVVGITTVGTTYPTVAGAFYTCQVAGALGTETEGQAGSVVGTGGTVLALNVGKAIPPQGTNVILTYVPYRWVFQYDG